MAITNFIPTVWSETLSRELDKQYIGVANCNRDFDGDIREMGSVVKICGLENVAVRDYTKNVNMKSADTLTDFSTDLTINQAKYFNFQIDDIDRAQASPKLMELAMKNAANALANTADAYVFNQALNAGHSIIDNELLLGATLDHFIRAREILYGANVMNNDDIVIEVTPVIASYIMKAKYNTASDNTALMERGCIGSIAGCKVYVSQNVKTDILNEGSTIISYCMMRTKRAIAFAEQLSEIQAYRPELRFADAVKGLYLYGAKTIYPNEIVRLELKTLSSI